MFRKMPSDANCVNVQFDGQNLELAEGGNLAAELLNAGIRIFRETPVSGAPRAPYCMMGSCFECLVEIDGVATQACMEQVSAGLKIEKMKVGREPSDE